MKRIIGVNIPERKRMLFAIQSIRGIGLFSAKEILEKAKIDQSMRAKDLTEADVKSLSLILQEYTVEGELRRQESADIKRLVEIKCYRGLRHRKNLPVRGQSTKTNARTRKGPRKGGVKK